MSITAAHMTRQHGVPPISLAKPFCSHIEEKLVKCTCGEEETDFEWVWGTKAEGSQAGSILLEEGERVITFNPEYSSGTAALRTTHPLKPGRHHYWELKMTSAVYGTNIMVGVCTASCDLSHGLHRFCSLLGRDEESWGYSYTGSVQHAGKFQQYGPLWGKGSIVGVLLDGWRGTLEFFLNRRPLGIAFTGLQNKLLYPVVASTSAHSGMKLITSCSYPPNLQFLSSQAVFSQLRHKLKVLPRDLPLPPGLRTFLKNNYGPFLHTPIHIKMEKGEEKGTVGKKHLLENIHSDDSDSEEYMETLHKRFCVHTESYRDTDLMTPSLTGLAGLCSSCISTTRMPLNPPNILGNSCRLQSNHFLSAFGLQPSPTPSPPSPECPDGPNNSPS